MKKAGFSTTRTPNDQEFEEIIYRKRKEKKKSLNKTHVNETDFRIHAGLIVKIVKSCFPIKMTLNCCSREAKISLSIFMQSIKYDPGHN